MFAYTVHVDTKKHRIPSWELAYPKTLLKMIFLFPRFDMWVPWIEGICGVQASGILLEWVNMMSKDNPLEELEDVPFNILNPKSSHTGFDMDLCSTTIFISLLTAHYHSWWGFNLSDIVHKHARLPELRANVFVQVCLCTKKRNGRKQRHFSMTTSMPKDNKNCSISKLECCPSIRAALCLRPKARDQSFAGHVPMLEMTEQLRNMDMAMENPYENPKYQ